MSVKNAVISMMYGVKVGETIEFMGREITRKLPGLWVINGIECIGVNDVFEAFGCK